MMKKRNKGKRALTAVGAVVAAGLTPGIVGAAPIQGSHAGFTAAEVVAISGSTFSFDELYAMQQVDRSQRHKTTQRPKSTSQQATRYGVPRPQAQAPKYAAPRPEYPPTTMYGVARPPIPAVIVEQSPTVDREEIQMGVMKYLMDYCNLLIDADKRGIIITPDSDLTRDLGMTEDDLKELKAEIEDYYGVEVSHHRFRLKGQLNTLRLVSEYITKIITIWD